MEIRKANSSLQTERLLLRWITEDDASLMLSIWNDPAFIRYVVDRGIRTEAQARLAIADIILKLYEDHGYGPYRVSTRIDDNPIGICGLFKRETLDAPDIGFGFLPEYCGQGYALESASAVMSHARDHMRIPRLAAIVSPKNHRSIRLIEKMRMAVEHSIRMPGEERDIVLYGIDL